MKSIFIKSSARTKLDPEYYRKIYARCWNKIYDHYDRIEVLNPTGSMAINSREETELRTQIDRLIAKGRWATLQMQVAYRILKQNRENSRLAN